MRCGLTAYGVWEMWQTFYTHAGVPVSAAVSDEIRPQGRTTLLEVGDRAPSSANALGYDAAHQSIQSSRRDSHLICVLTTIIPKPFGCFLANLRPTTNL